MILPYTVGKSNNLPLLSAVIYFYKTLVGIVSAIILFSLFVGEIYFLGNAQNVRLNAYSVLPKTQVLKRVAAKTNYPLALHPKI